MSNSDDGLTPQVSEVLDRDLSPGESVVASLSAISLSIGVWVTDLGNAFVAEVSNLFTRIQALGRFIAAFFDNPRLMLEAAAQADIQWITQTDLGPFNFFMITLVVSLSFIAWVRIGAPVPFFGRLTRRLR